MKTVTTHLSIGTIKNVFFGENNEHSIQMHDNKKFTKAFESAEDFLSFFTPTNPSENLLNRIMEEFGKKAGKITFKPIGFNSNMNFYFN